MELVNASIGKVQASHPLMNTQASCSVPVTAVKCVITRARFRPSIQAFCFAF